MRTFLPFESVAAEGDIYDRASANFGRLEETPYSPGELFRPADYGWPGDYEGRTLLAWVLLERATGRPAVHLQEALAELPSRLNERGYFGTVHPQGTIDEQQLSGHSWLLRALCELYEWKREASVLALIENIVRRLLLSAKGHYSRYPIDPLERARKGEAIGELTGEKIGSWYVSSDIGCAFILLDGATHAYELTKSEELKELIEEMIARFVEIDFVGVSMQTHATLSGLRGMMRYHCLHRETGWLPEIERLYDMYRTRGMTENYENHNWFGRPDWTETCAVVDSFMLAAQLWEETGEAAYLEDAHLILINGMGYGQRPNGGFGCNNCAGDEREELHPHPDLYEAHWCCSMRGGEGLARAIQYTFSKEEGGLSVVFFHNASAVTEWGGERLGVRLDTEYPLKGKAKLSIAESSLTEPKTLSLYVPRWAETSKLRLALNGVALGVQADNGFIGLTSLFRKGDVLELDFPIGLREEPAGGGGKTYRHGALLLGGTPPSGTVPAENPSCNETAHYRLPEWDLAPINELFRKAEDEARSDRKKVIFGRAGERA